MLIRVHDEFVAHVGSVSITFGVLINFDFFLLFVYGNLNLISIYFEG